MVHRRDALTTTGGVAARDVGRHRAGAHYARRPGAARSSWRRRLSWLTGFLVVLVAASVVGLLPLQLMRVGSDSMAPTIENGQLVLVERFDDPVRRMDVVAVRDPAGNGLLVKRAVALAGDSVGIEDGVLVVNGARVCEPTIDATLIDGLYFGPVTVPEGELFVLGDHRRESVDSRHFGPLPASSVVGLVQVRVWPDPGTLPAGRC